MIEEKARLLAPSVPGLKPRLFIGLIGPAALP